MWTGRRRRDSRLIYTPAARTTTVGTAVALISTGAVGACSCPGFAYCHATGPPLWANCSSVCLSLALWHFYNIDFSFSLLPSALSPAPHPWFRVIPAPHPPCYCILASSVCLLLAKAVAHLTGVVLITNNRKWNAALATLTSQILYSTDVISGIHFYKIWRLKALKLSKFSKHASTLQHSAARRQLITTWSNAAIYKNILFVQVIVLISTGFKMQRSGWVVKSSSFL